jgi:hypothetical protein
MSEVSMESLKEWFHSSSGIGEASGYVDILEEAYGDVEEYIKNLLDDI